jgi:hypothetical protein
MFLNMLERTPSLHSLVLRFSQPTSSFSSTALGSTCYQIVDMPISGVERALAKFFQTADLPRPAPPIKKIE